MKNILTLILVTLMATSNQAQIFCYSQADVDAVQAQNFNIIYLDNDTTLPLAQQIHDLSPLAVVDTMNLFSEDTDFENLDALANNVFYQVIIYDNHTLKNINALNENPLLSKLRLFNCSDLESVDLQLSSKHFDNFTLSNCDKVDSLLLTFPNAIEPWGGFPWATIVVEDNENIKKVSLTNPGEILGDFRIEGNKNLKEVSIPFMNKLAENSVSFVHNEKLTNINISSESAPSNVKYGAIQLRYNYRFEDACVFQEPIIQLQNLLDSLGLDHYPSLDVVTNGTNTSSVDAILNYDCSTSSIAEVSNAQGTVFPNPSTGVVHVRDLEEPSAFSLMSLQGTEVMQGVAQNQEALDMSHLPKGLYFLKLENQTPVKVVLE